MEKAKKPQAEGFDVKKAVQASKDIPNKFYANYAEFSMTNSEVYMDFYLINPSPGRKDLKADPVARILIPPSLVKGFVTAVANMVDHHEKAIDTEIPNSRTPLESDTIKIW